MEIIEYNLYQYALKLRQPLTVKSQTLNVREGLLLIIKSASGHTGIGEIAPLPGFSSESLDEALQQAMGLKDFLLNQEIPQDIEKLEGQFETWLGELELTPSVRFGIEMSILTLIANQKGLALNELVSDRTHKEVRVNGLLQGTPDQVISQAKELVSQHFTALKLKVGDDVEKDIQLVRSVTEAIEGRAILHLDANQKWTVNEAVHFGHEVGLAAVDYIEEPFAETEQIPDFFMKTTIPVALDESLQKLSYEDIRKLEGVDALVLKPTMLGSIERTRGYMMLARKFAFKSVISSSFESDVGILILANLAGSISRNNDAGLDTLKWFSEGLLQTELKIEEATLKIADRDLAIESLNMGLLTKI